MTSPTLKHPRLLTLAAWLTCAALVACTSQPVSNSAATAYSGLFISDCGELSEGLYYADALELKPKNASTVEAQYIKTLFNKPQCDASARLIQLKLPPATWELLGQIKIGDQTVDRVSVTHVAGTLVGIIANPDKVKETNVTYDIHFGQKNDLMPLQKQTDASVTKELRLVKGDRLYMSDADSPIAQDGFPSALLPPEEHFKKQ